MICIQQAALGEFLLLAGAAFQTKEIELAEHIRSLSHASISDRSSRSTGRSETSLPSIIFTSV